MANHYHMSKTVLNSGAILKNLGRVLTSTVVEDILSRNKPSTIIDRSSAVFVSVSQDFSKQGLPYKEGYIHEVQVCGSISCHDNRWIGELTARHSLSDKLPHLSEASQMDDDEIATNYWTGAASSDPNWEHLASEAVVVTCCSSTPIEIGSTNPDSLESLIRHVQSKSDDRKDRSARKAIVRESDG